MKGKVFILLPPLLSLSLYNIYFKKGRDYILKCVCSGNKFISINLRAWIYWIKREREGERDTGNHSGTSINYDFLVLVNAVLYFIKNIEARYVSLFFFAQLQIYYIVLDGCEGRVLVYYHGREKWEERIIVI